MNQAVQFPEREWWDETQQAVCFIALVNGFSLTCAIHGEALLRRYPDGQDAMHCFTLHRWETEEEAEQAINDGREDAQGWIWLSSAR